MIKVCAILAAYNEADIIEEAVRKLIAGGVEVFVIDNGSTDRTVEILSPLVGKGVVDIRTVKFREEGREIYDWTSILRLKEDLSRKLGFDWYLHVDADEIRYAPWPQLTLREGLDRVDHSGYNLVNFKLFNFRLTHDMVESSDYERDMPNYSVGEYFNQYQVKAWKAHRDIDITAHGGHIARRPDARIYPVRFIHKHYPVRSLQHGRRKILQERKERFNRAEKQLGWHVQYDHMADVTVDDVFWSSSQLTRFDMQQECIELLDEGANVACNLLSAVNLDALDGYLEKALLERFSPEPFKRKHVRQLVLVSRQLLALVSKGSPPPVECAANDISVIRTALSLMASRQWLNGDPSALQRISSIILKSQSD
jgi:hypothetical protein